MADKQKATSRKKKIMVSSKSKAMPSSSPKVKRSQLTDFYRKAAGPKKK